MSSRGDLKVTIAGLEFFGRGLQAGTTPELVLKPRGFKGWTDGVDMRLDDSAIPNQHGSYDRQAYRSARVVSLDSYALTDSNAKLQQIGERVTGLLSGGELGRIEVVQNGETRWADCRLASKTKFEEIARDTAEVQVQVWCPDPRKFGDVWTYTATVGGGVVPGVRHFGNAEATPQFVVAGDMPGGYRLTFRGENFHVIWPLVSGQPHTIDYADGQLWVGGVRIHGGLGITNTPTLPGGVVTALGVVPLTTGTGTATLKLFDTYI
ncbi:hypothetical protein ACIPY3_02655 [Paenarthrobacter sp. NPDC089714]|uniref:hypothetical protein n=1 Tax=Paenarthrobacter sp. NPDC089714 TaxID=3364377 RepID=UPI00381C5A3F